MEPGGIQSDFAKTVLERLQREGGMPDDEYAPLLAEYIHRARSRKPEEVAKIYQTPQQVAQVVADCIDNPEPPLRLRTSLWAEAFCRYKTSADLDGRTQLKMVTQSTLGVEL